MDNLISYQHHNDGLVFNQPAGYDIMNRDPKLLTMYSYLIHPTKYLNWKMQFVNCWPRADDKFNRYSLFCQVFESIGLFLPDVIIDYIMYLIACIIESITLYNPERFSNDILTYINWWLNTSSADKPPLLCCDAYSTCTALLVYVIYEKLKLADRLFISCAYKSSPKLSTMDDITEKTHVYSIPNYADVLLGFHISSIDNIKSAHLLFEGREPIPLDMTYTCAVQTINSTEKFYLLPDRKALFCPMPNLIPNLLITIHDRSILPDVHFILSFLSVEYRCFLVQSIQLPNPPMDLNNDLTQENLV